MNVEIVLKHLNDKYGCKIKGDCYDKINIWLDWWKGLHKPFHEFKESNGENTITREMYTLKMGKKVCEDWSSMLLNEKTEIAIDDEASSKFVLGDDGNGGILGDTQFWIKANELVEKAFATGTGAIVAKVKGAIKQGDTISGGNIRFNYIRATNIFPLTIEDGRITEITFATESIVRGKTRLWLETHLKENDKYKIINEYFEYKNSSLVKLPLPEGIAETVSLDSNIPLFAIITPNIVNNEWSENGLGISVYANAIDNLKGVDLAFNNFCRDFKLGGKKVFMDSSITKINSEGKRIAPDDVAQQLFIETGDGFLDKNGNNNKINEYNPSLRVQENKDGIQGQLDYLSFKCGLGTKHYQFNSGTVVTATQYTGDKQDLIQHANKHYIVVENALKEIVRAVLFLGKTVLRQSVSPDAKITINFDDSYIIDKESERLRDLQEMREGILSKVEYRVKWYGESEDEAKEAIANMDVSSSFFGE